jgi:hypothetical protein
MRMQMAMGCETPSLDDQIEEIAETFDFDAVRTLMIAQGWKWPGVAEVTGEDGWLPTAEDMETLARRMLREVAGRVKDGTLRRVGFVASKRHGLLSLHFSAEVGGLL